MPNVIVFGGGIEYLGELLDLSGDFRWLLLLDGTTLDCDSAEFVDDVSANEPSDASYGRVAQSGLAVSTVGCITSIDCDDPAFVGFDGAEQVGWLVLYRHNASDALAALMMAFAVDWVADGSDYTPTINANGLLQIRQGGCLISTTD